MTETQTIDRRVSDNSAILVLVQQISTNVGNLEVKVDKFDTRLSQHMHDETLELAEAIVKLMLRAFPEGDPDGHKRHHEAVIKAAEEKAEFWKSMRKKVTEWGLVGVLGWAAFALWAAFLKGPVK